MILSAHKAIKSDFWTNHQQNQPTARRPSLQTLREARRSSLKNSTQPPGADAGTAPALKTVKQHEIGVQAAPEPWTRFWFPEHLGVESHQGNINPFYRHFDVYKVPPRQTLSHCGAGRGARGLPLNAVAGVD